MHETYLIKDEGIIRLLCAIIIVNRLPLEPVWLFLVAPSGGGKTEFIRALFEVTGVYQLSSLTSNTFISGMKRTGKETSLLFRIGSRGTILIKDFTSILNIHQDERRDIMGQLREIYDGSYTKHFGTGDSITWKGHIGLVAGVTTVIHVVRELYAAMGERFVMYSPVLPERMDIAERAMRNAEELEDKRKEIAEAMRMYLDEEIGVPTAIPKPPEDLFQEIKELAEFSTRARSPVERNWKGNQEITYVHIPEAPTRFGQQLLNLARALMILGQGSLQNIDRHILHKIALDSITSTRRQTLQELTRYEKVSTTGLANKLGYPTDTSRRWLEDLTALGMVNRQMIGKEYHWTIKDNYRKVVERFEGIKPTDITLDFEEADREKLADDSLPADDPSPSQSGVSSSDDKKDELVNAVSLNF